ncbi:hypothetical protein, partial [Cellulophaga sp. BC115SP]|uniref:hypothetical protein n=1 Tax=Cellulophaga sp. BC115SP TaxID=2683263 RepID=UPI0014131897
GVQDIYDQYKQTKDLSKVNYNQATLRAATTAVIAGLLNSGLSFSKFSLSSSALLGAKLAWLRPNLFANLMTLTRAERTQLADALQNVSDDVLTRLENPTFFADFSKAILVSGSTPSSGILSSVSRVQSWVNSWLGIKDKALKWVRSTTLTGTLGIMTLTGSPQVEARIIDNSGIIETVMRVPNVASGLINGNSSEISSIVSQASAVAEVNASQILDQTGEALSSSSGTYEVLQSTINSVQNILVRLKTSSMTSTQPIVLIKDGKTYKIGDDSKCVYCGKTVLKPASGEDNTEYTLCQDLNTLQARGGTNGNAGVTKLCSTFPTVASLRPIVTRLLSFTSGEIQAFFGDIAPSTCGGNAYLCGNINSLTVGLIDAWKVVYDAKPTSKFKQDYEILQAVRTIQNNPNKLAAFTNNGGTIVSFIQKYDQSRCKICGNQGLASLPELEDILLNTAEVYEKHHNETGFMGWYNREVFASNISYEVEPEGEVRNIPSIGRDGAQHMIKYMVERSFADNTDAIDQNFPPTAPYPNRQYDIRVNDQIRFVEFKSYKTTTSLNTTASAEQLMSYLSQIGSMAELRYVFNDRKTNLSEAKTKMQGLFQGSKKDEIFETIWNNAFGLRVDVFPTRPNTAQGKADALQDFNNMVG